MNLKKLNEKLKKELNEALPAPVGTEIAMASKYAGTSHPEMVDWSSGAGSAGQTDLGKRALKKKKKDSSIVRRKLFGASVMSSKGQSK